MNKIQFKENYQDYEKVKNAFKAFVHALVLESMYIDNGVHEDKVKKIIERYCKAMGNGIIHDVNKQIRAFIKSFESHYSVHLYELNENGDAIGETAKHINTNNLVTALKMAAEFYRTAKNPQVNIYDNYTDEYIAKWD